VQRKQRAGEPRRKTEDNEESNEEDAREEVRHEEAREAYEKGQVLTW
jgi:hypothetical protein